MKQANAYNAYKTNEVMSASQGKLVLMLYDGAIRFIKLAVIALKENKIEKVNENMTKAQNVLTEFMSTLDFDQGGEIAGNLYNLYEYMYFKLVRANIDKDEAGMEEVRVYLEELRETWAKI